MLDAERLYELGWDIEKSAVDFGAEKLFNVMNVEKKNKEEGFLKSRKRFWICN